MTILIYIIAGLFLGFLSGLLGIGGGLIGVPALSWIFALDHVPTELRMHLAVGTSLASIVMTSLVSVRVFHYQESVRWPLVWRLLPGIVLGTFLGLSITRHLSSYHIRVLFAIFVLYMAIRFWWTSHPESNQEKPLHPFLKNSYFLFIISAMTSMLACIIGVGGTVILIPFLLYGGLPMRQASGTSLGCAIFVSLTGMLGLMIIGWHEPNLPPFSTGYVVWPAALGLSIPSIFSVNLGARLGKKLPHHLLKRCFAVFLLVVSLDMYFFK